MSIGREHKGNNDGLLEEVLQKEVLKDAVKEQYNIGDSVSLESIKHPGWNYAFRVVTEEGGFFLRKYRSDVPPIVIDTEAPLVDFLSRGGLPVPRVLQNKQEHFISYTSAKEPFFIQGYVEGYSPSRSNNLNSQQLISAAQSLAVFHQFIGEQMQAIGNEVPMEISDYTFSSEIAKNAWEMALVVIKAQEMDQTNEQIIQTAPMKLEELADIDDVRINEMVRVLPKGVIHNDFAPRSIIFTENNVAAIIDWEAARYQQRLLDVVKAVCNFCGTDMVEAINSPIDLGKAKQFISTYEEINPLTSEEKDIMFLLAYLGALDHTTNVLTARFINNDKRMALTVPREFAYSTWWKDNHENVRMAIFG